jgi:glycosyltransferase involved in cell wall biosynthesis
MNSLTNLGCERSEHKTSIFYLFICADYPGYGGAATNIYEIFNEYKKHFSCCILFVTECNFEYTLNNIGIDTFVTNDDNLKNTVANILKIIYHFSRVNIVYKIHSILPNVIRPHFNVSNISKIIYLCSGIKTINKEICKLVWDSIISTKMLDGKPNTLSIDIHKFINNDIILDETDMNCINTADIVVVNSNITYNYIKHNIPSTDNFHKINTSIMLKNINININHEKKFDIIFTCSSYLRFIKNPQLAVEIFSDGRLENFNKLIIGSGFPSEKLDQIKNLTYIDKLLSNSEFIEVLSSSKTIFIPSFYDSMPNVLYEAICNGVTPIVSNIIECELLNSSNYIDIYKDQSDIIDTIINCINTNMYISFDKIETHKESELLKFKYII